MNEWTVVSVIIALVGLFVTIGKPLAKIVTELTEMRFRQEQLEKRRAEEEADRKTAEADRKTQSKELTNAILLLQQSVTTINNSNSSDHRRIWKASEKQTIRLDIHDRRIDRLEHGVVSPYKMTEEEKEKLK